MEMMIMEKAFRGDRLKELRLNRGWPQDDTAAKLGITPATLSRFENGKRQPDPSTLVLLADTFDVTVDYLVGRVDNPENTLTDYIEQVSITNKLIGMHFTEEELNTLTQEKIDKIVSYMKDQIALSISETSNKEQKK
ncbi:helix-turn-helix transcriptional regulator [Exiguobacterium sp. s191]|uniref:helix-turn-helix domain-containing protein n=1 Tax=Exiguobacterium sp. s191 TaxID=2751196 RepID=UPI001BE8B8BF|nr:helix-turn-helix transcriptional regulator [Exiguobacterium sp. s191]